MKQVNGGILKKMNRLKLLLLYKQKLILMASNYYINSFFWSSISAVLKSIVNFISVPILLKYFGVDTYGVLTLATSINAYVAILDLGVNTGSTKFYSQWIGSKKYDLIKKVAGTSISFYGLLGLINSIILLIIVFFGEEWFNITKTLFEQFKTALIIMSLFSIINWITSVFTQLINANEKIAFIHKIKIINTLLNFALIFLTVTFRLTFGQYFFFSTLIGTLVVIPYYFKSKSDNLVYSLLPKFYWNDFKIVLVYGLSIFAMGIFQSTATKSRPIILGLFTNNTPQVLAEYKIMDVFPSFILLICGTLLSIFLPKSSKYVENNNTEAINRLAYDGTKFTTLLVCLVCFPIMVNAGEILEVYVGKQYTYLSSWLILWCGTLIITIFNTPISSLVLATGKTRMLVFSSAIACIISMFINAFLSKYYGVGSAVIGYLIYILIQQSFYFFYFNGKVLHLNSNKIFKSFLYPVLLGFISFGIIYLTFNFQSDNRSTIILLGIIKGLSWVILYGILLFTFKILNFTELKRIVRTKNF